MQQSRGDCVPSGFREQPSSLGEVNRFEPPFVSLDRPSASSEPGGHSTTKPGTEADRPAMHAPPRIAHVVLALAASRPASVGVASVPQPANAHPIHETRTIFLIMHRPFATTE